MYSEKLMTDSYYQLNLDIETHSLDHLSCCFLQKIFTEEIFQWRPSQLRSLVQTDVHHRRGKVGTANCECEHQPQNPGLHDHNPKPPVFTLRLQISGNVHVYKLTNLPCLLSLRQSEGVAFLFRKMTYHKQIILNQNMTSLDY